MFMDRILSVISRYYDQGNVKFNIVRIFGKNCLYIFKGYKVQSFFAEAFEQYFKSNNIELKIRNLKQNLDKISCDYIDDFMRLSKIWGNYTSMNYWSDYDTNLLKKYETMAFKQPVPEIAAFNKFTFLNKYGLFDLPQAVLDTVNGKDIIDAGGCNGDTALIFKDLFPDSAIYVYEPLSVYCDIVKKVADKINSYGEGGAISPIHKGLGARQERIDISFNCAVENCEITTIDADYKGNNLGLIKMDTEGFESQIVAGASELIRQYKPVLVIAIYHTPEDFFEMKDKISKLNPEYKFMIRRSEFAIPTADLVLIAY